MSQWWVRRSSSAVVILASPKTLGPFTECQVSRDDNRGAFRFKSADEVEQKLAAGLGERRVTEGPFQHDEVHACQMFGEPALASIAGLDLEPVDQIDDVVEATT